MDAVKRIKTLFQARNQKIKNKLVAGFVLIIVLFTITNIYTTFEGRRLINMYDGILENHLLLNDLFVTLGEGNNRLEDYLHEGTSLAYSDYKGHQASLYEVVDELLERNQIKEYSRELVDLSYMIDSYYEQAEQAVIVKQEGNLAESNRYFYSAQEIYGLINETFSDLYTEILWDTNSIKREISNTRRIQFAYNVFLTAIIGVFSFFFVEWFATSVTKPINHLTELVSNFSSGNENLEMIPITTNDEVKVLSEAFNEMILRINDQIAELIEKNKLEKKLSERELENLKIKNLLKESELSLLQSRINPHFLFNSLNIISQMSYIEGAEQTTSLLESMADFLRYNMDKLNKVVTIEDEVGNVKDYFVIQRKRFGERISFSVQKDPDAGLAQIPCLIIQPLVENAVIHGVGFYTENGVVKVGVHRENQRVILSVIDNGVGMDDSKLQVIREMIQAEGIPDEQAGIGLRNVIARLKLYYKSDVLITVKSEVNKGTEIRIDLPLWEKDVEHV